MQSIIVVLANEAGWEGKLMLARRERQGLVFLKQESRQRLSLLQIPLGLLEALDKHSLLLMPRLAKAYSVVEPHNGFTTGHGLAPEVGKGGG
jgi:hypothetical protein